MVLPDPWLVCCIAGVAAKWEQLSAQNLVESQLAAIEKGPEIFPSALQYIGASGRLYI